MSRGIAVVSGITGGIGSVVGQRLLDADFTVVGLSRSPAQLGCTQHYRCNVRHSPDVAWAVAQVQHTYHHCEVLVCCHGAEPLTLPSLDVPLDRFLEVITTDLVGSWLLAQACGRMMVQQGRGAIVFLSSLHARQTYPARAAYAAAKSGLCGMMRSLALEWGPHGIRVNAILPWQVAGPRTELFLELARARGEDLEEAYLQRTPLRQLIQPGAVADLVLAVIDTPGLTGAELVLDGGVGASMWHQGFLP